MPVRCNSDPPRRKRADCAVGTLEQRTLLNGHLGPGEPTRWEALRHQSCRADSTAMARQTSLRQHLEIPSPAPWHATGSFPRQHSFRFPSNQLSDRARFLAGDGELDLISPGYDFVGPLHQLRAMGRCLTNLPWMIGHGTITDAAAADFNGDGILGYRLGSTRAMGSTQEHVRACLGLGAGYFWLGHTLCRRFCRISIAAGDLNGAGRPGDLVTANWGSTMLLARPVSVLITRHHFCAGASFAHRKTGLGRDQRLQSRQSCRSGRGEQFRRRRNFRMLELARDFATP